MIALNIKLGYLRNLAMNTENMRKILNCDAFQMGVKKLTNITYTMTFFSYYSYSTD